jgi:outer membrane protein assembly factor BamB
LDGKTGTKKWEFATDSKVTATPVVGKDGTVIVGSTYGKVYGLNGQTGEKEWEFAGRGKLFWAAAVGADGTVYVGAARETFVALDGKTGSKKWEYKKEDFSDLDMSTPRWAPPVIGGDGTVYVGTGFFSRVFALDGKTGAKKWEYKFGDGRNPGFLAMGKNGILYYRTRSYIKALKTDDQTSSPSPWPMFGKNAQHTGRAPAK